MFSPGLPPPSPAVPLASRRRGGPMLFGALWPCLQASLLEAAAHGSNQPMDLADAAAGPSAPPHASAA